MKKPSDKPLYPCIERTVEFPVGDYLYRLWIAEEDLQEQQDYANMIKDIKDFAPSHTREEVIKMIGTLGNVNAVQIKSKGFPEYGLIVYYVDF